MLTPSCRVQAERSQAGRERPPQAFGRRRLALAAMRAVAAEEAPAQEAAQMASPAAEMAGPPPAEVNAKAVAVAAVVVGG